MHVYYTGTLAVLQYSKTFVKQPLKKKTKQDLNDKR